MTSASTDERLGQRVDDQEFDGLFLAHARRVTRLAALLGAEDAEDVAQEAFCNLYAARSRLRAKEVDVVAYLNRIVVNEVRSRARRKGVLRSKSHLVPVQVSAPAVDGARVAVLAELRRLPPRQREALVLRFWLDLPLAAVGEAMGIREGTAKSMVSRGLQALGTALGDEGEGS